MTDKKWSLFESKEYMTFKYLGFVTAKNKDKAFEKAKSQNIVDLNSDSEFLIIESKIYSKTGDKHEKYYGKPFF